MLLGNREILLESRVCHHPVGIQIAEVKLTAFFVSDSCRTGTVGGVSKDPAIGLHIEAYPVVSADEIRFGGQTALPLGRDPGAAAERNEQQRENTAVTGIVSGTIFRHVFQYNVAGHVGIFHVLCYEVIECACLLQGVVDATGQFFRQCLNVGGKYDMGSLLLYIEVIGSCNSGSIIRVSEFGGMEVGILHQKFVVFLQFFFPADGPLTGILRSNPAVFRPDLFNADIALLLACFGDGQVCPNEHTGSIKFVLHFYRCPDPDAGSQGAFFLHLPHGNIPAAGLLGAVCGAFHAGKQDPCPLSKFRNGLAQ